jgi:hypothetical protein
MSGEAMSELAGITGNGFDYTATYATAVQDSVVWAATYRRKGDCHGVRHGRVFHVAALTPRGLQAALMVDIEQSWGDKH